MSLNNRPNFWTRVARALSILWDAILGKPLKMHQLEYALDMAPQDPKMKRLFNTKKSTTYQFQVTMHRQKKEGNQWG